MVTPCVQTSMASIWRSHRSSLYKPNAVSRGVPYKPNAVRRVDAHDEPPS